MNDPLKRAAEVLREYAEMIEDGEMNLSGPLKGRCAPVIEEELAEYRQLAKALVARSESLQTSAVAHPDKEPDLFLCCGDGEGTHEFKVCRGYEGVAAFYEAMCGRDADDTLDSLKRTFEDPEEWRNDGTALKLELYCARFYVWKVTAAEIAMPGAHSSCACEVGDDDSFIEKCALHSDWLKALLDIALCRMDEDGRRGAVTMEVFGPWARHRAAEVIPEDEYQIAVEALNGGTR